MSSEALLFALLAITGLAGGFLAGMLGIGGGLIYIAVLPEVCTLLGVPSQLVTQFTIANSLFATLIGSVAASISHMRKGATRPNASLVIGISAIVTSTSMLYFVVNTPAYNRSIFSGIVCLLLTYLIIRGFRPGCSQPSIPPVEAPIQQNVWKFVAVGVLGGAVSPLSGLGGSVVMIPALRNWLRYDIKIAGIISLGVVFLQSASSTVLNVLYNAPQLPGVRSFGLIIVPVALILGISVAIASPLGAMASRKMKASVLHYCFIGTLLLILAKSLSDLLL